jgi:CubicO group peptidase (beta-lactamase class C family)
LEGSTVQAGRPVKGEETMRKLFGWTVLTLVLLTGTGRAAGATLSSAKPEEAGMSSRQLAFLDDIVGAAVARKDFPGAVLLVARKGKVVYRRAFGNSQIVPESRPMTADMIFDLASVTKPVATATSIMLLVERGDIRLWDRVRLYVPEFLTWYGEKGIAGEEARLYNLLTHTSGLPPYTDAKEAAKKLGDPCATADLVKLIAGIPKELPVGKEFVYSCLNYITLAHIIHKVSGKAIDEFAAENIFKPLGMTRTFYRPPANLIDQCVPTEVIDGRPLRGIVHDPLARLQGGVSGNAGLFSTADDLAVFAQMLLRGGEWNGVRILSPLTVERMTEIYPKVGLSGRGLGWDIDTDYATVRGDLFGPRSYGHSGYTGTSIWIDPETETSVIFLTNRVHPDDKGDIIALRSKVANVVAAAIRGK